MHLMTKSPFSELLHCYVHYDKCMFVNACKFLKQGIFITVGSELSEAEEDGDDEDAAEEEEANEEEMDEGESILYSIQTIPCYTFHSVDMFERD